MTDRPTVIRVAAIDDQTLQRDGQSRLVGDGFTMVGTFASVEEFLTSDVTADVVLLDLWLNSGQEPRLVQGSRAIEVLVSRGYRVLIYTIDRRREVLAHLLRHGASGVVIKTEPIEALTEAIVRIGAGEVVLTRELAGLADLYLGEGLLPRLSPRQAEVLTWRARGLKNVEVAERLHISIKTVERAVTEVNAIFKAYLEKVDLDDLDPRTSHSAALLATTLGYGPGDLMDPEAPPYRPFSSDL